jgi:hypothetical protein
MSWPPGSQVVVRSRPDGDVGYCFPATVVADESARSVLFQPAGSVCMRRSGPRGGPQGRNLIDWDGSYRDVIVERSTVHMQLAGDPFWVIRGWEDGGIVGWYINLAAPWTRFALGFDTEDHMLDVVVADDRSSWSWKDEDELAWMVERGSYAPERADEIRRNGESAIDRLERREPPFDDATWSGIVIDPAGPIPVLPEDWQVP